MGGAGTAVLLLADGRFPAGGHAHSGGVEAAVADGRVADDATLEAFVRGRLLTTGLVEAALAAATLLRCAPPPDEQVSGDSFLAASTSLEESRTTSAGRARSGPTMAFLLAELADLDAEAEARVPPPPLRAASRRLGRQLLRAATRCWPHALLDRVAETTPGGLHQPVALGVVGVAAGLTAAEVAALAVHHAITTPAQAAVRLLGLDPFAVAALTARLSPDGDRVVAEALAAAGGALAELPARTGPLVDIAAVEHAGRDSRLFAT